MAIKDTIDFSAAEAELARREEKAKKRVQTSAEIHKKMVENFNRTKDEISKLKARRDAIDNQIKALEAKQENRKNFHKQFTSDSKKE